VTSSTWTRRSWVTNNHDASGKMIELKFFGEQTITQMAEQLGCAKATIEIPARPVATAAKPPNRATEIGDLCHQIESTRPSVLTLLRFLLSARGLTDLCDSCSRRVGRLHRGVEAYPVELSGHVGDTCFGTTWNASSTLFLAMICRLPGVPYMVWRSRGCQRNTSLQEETEPNVARKIPCSHRGFACHHLGCFLGSRKCRRGKTTLY
jgi:hypothetical protein